MPTTVHTMKWGERPRPGHPDDVRIDRGTRWENRFVIGWDGDRAEVIRRYEKALRATMARSPKLKEAVAALHGKRLFCWCAPLPCHGDVLAKLAAELVAERTEENPT